MACRVAILEGVCWQGKWVEGEGEWLRVGQEWGYHEPGKDLRPGVAWGRRGKGRMEQWGAGRHCWLCEEFVHGAEVNVPVGMDGLSKSQTKVEISGEITTRGRRRWWGGRDPRETLSARLSALGT